MRKYIFLVLIVVVSISACTLPSAETPAPTADLVATQVAVQLSKEPTSAQQVTVPPAVTVATTAAASKSATPTSTATITIPPTITTTPTITPTATVTTIPTFTPSPTVDVSDPRAKLGAPIWKDTFANGTSWGLGTAYDDGDTRIEVKSSALILTSAKAIGWVGWRTTSKKPTDFYLEATIQTKDCSTSDTYGLVFRTAETASKTSGYWFGVTCDGRYNLRKGDVNAFTEIAKLTASPLIKAGSNQVNRIGVWVKGSKISMYANGKLLSELTDVTYPDTDSIGVFIAGIKTLNFTIQCTEFGYWNVP